MTCVVFAQSAARSKERKLRYIAELQEKVANLQNEVNSMTHQLRGLCDDTATLGMLSCHR